VLQDYWDVEMAGEDQALADRECEVFVEHSALSR
jgi:hypothetical protein